MSTWSLKSWSKTSCTLYSREHAHIHEKSLFLNWQKHLEALRLRLVAPSKSVRSRSLCRERAKERVLITDSVKRREVFGDQSFFSIQRINKLSYRLKSQAASCRLHKIPVSCLSLPFEGKDRRPKHWPEERRVVLCLNTFNAIFEASEQCKPWRTMMRIARNSCNNSIASVNTVSNPQLVGQLLKAVHSPLPPAFDPCIPILFKALILPTICCILIHTI